MMGVHGTHPAFLHRPLTGHRGLGKQSMREERPVWFYYYPHISAHTLSSHNNQIPHAHCLVHNLAQPTGRFTRLIFQHKVKPASSQRREGFSLLCVPAMHRGQSFPSFAGEPSIMGQTLNLKLSVKGVQAVI